MSPGPKSTLRSGFVAALVAFSYHVFPPHWQGCLISRNGSSETGLQGCRFSLFSSGSDVNRRSAWWPEPPDHEWWFSDLRIGLRTEDRRPTTRRSPSWPNRPGGFATLLGFCISGRRRNVVVM